MPLFLLIALLAPWPTIAATVVTDVPPETTADAKYVFYLHGRIIEQQGLRPTHPRWGLYDYPAIVEALAQGNITLISERREKGSDPDEYAKKVYGQIQQLVEAGAVPSDITVVGFSAGGVIAMKVSAILLEHDVNFVFLASCSGWLKKEPELKLHGHVLSIYEESDGPASCAPVARRKPGPSEFTEVAINTGKEHGAFYLPRDEWVTPVLDWIRAH